MKRELRIYIEAELRDYHRNKAELDEAYEQMMGESPVIQEGPRGSGISNPTQAKALRLLTCRRLNYMTNIHISITNALDKMGEERYRLVELKYWERPRKLTDAGIAMELNIDRRTLYRWTEQICMMIAMEMGISLDYGSHKDVTFRGVK